MISMLTRLARAVPRHGRRPRNRYADCHIDPHLLRDIGLEPQMVTLCSFAGPSEQGGIRAVWPQST